MGQAIRQALGDKSGIRRYGHFTLPMEETLATAAVDLGGRYFFVFDVAFSASKIGDFDSELVEDFWQAMAAHALCNLHVKAHYGRNNHHISEAVFKAAARAASNGRRTGSSHGRCAKYEGHAQLVVFEQRRHDHISARCPALNVAARLSSASHSLGGSHR